MRVETDAVTQHCTADAEQPVVHRVATLHEQVLAQTPGDRSQRAQAAERGVIPPSLRVAALGKQRGEHADTDAGVG